MDFHRLIGQPQMSNSLEQRSYCKLNPMKLYKGLVQTSLFSCAELMQMTSSSNDSSDDKHKFIINRTRGSRSCRLNIKWLASASRIMLTCMIYFYYGWLADQWHICWWHIYENIFKSYNQTTVIRMFNAKSSSVYPLRKCLKYQFNARKTPSIAVDMRIQKRKHHSFLKKFAEDYILQKN